MDGNETGSRSGAMESYDSRPTSLAPDGDDSDLRVFRMFRVYGAPFSHLFTELKISPNELKISSIELEISPIQLKISPNQLEISTNRPI